MLQTIEKLKTDIAVVSYQPIACGMSGNIAWVKYKRLVTEVDEYEFYGDDADTYKNFDEEGFVRSQKVETFREGLDWIKNTMIGEAEADDGNEH